MQAGLNLFRTFVIAAPEPGSPGAFQSISNPDQHRLQVDPTTAFLMARTTLFLGIRPKLG